MFAALTLLALIGSSTVFAQRTASVTGNWSNNATWGGSTPPTSADAVTINSGVVVTVDVAAAACLSITLNAPAANNGITISGANSLAVTNAITMNMPSAGVITSTIAVGTGTLSAASIAIPGSGTAGRNCILSVSTGTINVTGAITFSGTAAQAQLTFTGAGTLNIGGNLSAGGTFAASTGTVVFNAAGAQTVGGYTYNNLTLSNSGAKTTAGVTVNGILSMQGTATASAVPTYGASATLQYNTATSRNAGVEWLTPFAGTGGVIIANTGTITLTIAKVFNASVPLTINSGSTLATGNLQLTFGGNFVNNGGTFTAGSSTIVIANTMVTQSIAGFTTTGNVSMTKASGTATISGNVSAANLAVSAAGTLVLGGSNTFSGTRTVTAGTLTLANISALGAAGTAVALNGGTLDLMTDASVNAYNVTVGAAASISSDRATSGAGITHTLGTLSIGNFTLSITVGTNNTDGKAGLTFGTTTFSAATPIFNVAAGANLTLGALSGNFAFTKQGAGQLTLNTASARSAGVTTLSAGTMVLGSTSALGTTATTLTLSGGTLDLMTDVSVNAYNVTVSGNAAISSDRATSGTGITHTLGTLSIGNFTLSITVGTNNSDGKAGLMFGTTTLSASTPIFDVASGANLTLGAVGGAFAMTKQGAGQMTLATTSTRTTVAGITTLSAGTLRLNIANALNTSAAAPLNLNGGTLSLGVTAGATYGGTATTVGGSATVESDRLTTGAGVTQTLGTLSIGNFQLNVTVGANVNTGTAGVTFGTTTLSASTPTFDVPTGANLTLGALTGGFDFRKQNSGQITLNTASARAAGSSTLAAGTMVLGSASALGTTATTLVLSGGTLDLAISSTVNAYPTTVGGDAIILSNTATAVPGITHVLGTLSIGANTLTVNKGANATGTTAAVSFGNLTMTGSPTFSPGTASLLMTGTSSGNYKLTKSGAGTLQKTTAGWSLANDFGVTTGIYDANGQTTTVAGLTTVSGGEYQAKAALQTFNGGLTISGGTFTGAAGNVTSTDVTLSSGTLTAPSGTFSVTGNWSNAGATFTPGANTVTFSGAGLQTIGGSSATTFSNLTISGTSVTLTNNAPIAGNFLVSTGTMDLSTFSANRTVAGGTLTLSNGALLRIGGTNTLPANFSTHSIGATSTIEYYGTNQSIATLNSAQHYGNLTLSGSSTKTAAGALIVDGAFNNSVTTSIGTYALTLNGTKTNSGTMQFAGASNGILFIDGTVEYNGTSAQAPAGQTIALGIYNNLLLSNDAVKIVTGGTVRTQSSLSVDSGVSLNVTGTGILNVDLDLSIVGPITNSGTINVGN